MNINKKRLAVLAGGVGAVGAVAALSLGATSALYTSAADSQNNVIESGTIALVGNAPGSVELHETNFMPGDSKTSKYVLSYEGADAFAGFDIAITSTAQKACAGLADGPVTAAQVMSSCTEPGTVPMFNGDATSGSLDLTVNYVSGVMGSSLLGDGAFTNVASCNVAAGIVTCVSNLQNVLLPPRSISGAPNDLVWNDGMSTPVGVKVTLPLAAGNVFQGSDVHIDLTGHAVQAANNSATWSAGGSSAGTTRPGTATAPALLFPMSWS